MSNLPSRELSPRYPQQNLDDAEPILSLLRNENRSTVDWREYVAAWWAYTMHDQAALPEVFETTLTLLSDSDLKPESVDIRELTSVAIDTEKL